MNCKICKKKKIKKILNLGLNPLANKYPKSKKFFLHEKKFPLLIYFCPNCLTAQISKIISRKELFSNYYYLSSINLSLVKHFNFLAYKLKKSRFVLDIGSNDGILLKPLKKLGVNCLGVDPSINVGKIANDIGLTTFVSFFDKKIVNKIIKHYSKPDVIVASSIFTHLKDPNNFLKNIKLLLQNNGTFILEIEYLSNFIKKLEFERFYFDRPFYYSLTAINKLCKINNLSLFNIEFINVHGSSVRCYIRNKRNVKKSTILNNFMYFEKKFLSSKKIINFESILDKNSKYLLTKLKMFKKNGKKVIGYGCPARVSTITNYIGINKDLIKYIIDDNPLKQNRYTPGTHIPIYSKKKLFNEKIDIVIVFAYEYFDEIKKNFSKSNCEFYKPFPFKLLNK